jgi:protein-disulfide isomerase
MCAAEQDRFPEFHRLLFELQGQPDALTRAGFLQVAAELGLDGDAFSSCFDSGRYNSAIQQNREAASRAGVTGTPIFFVNDQILKGNQPLTAFQQQIAARLETGNAN